MQHSLLGRRPESSFCAKLGQYWMRIFNALLILEGILIGAFALYIAIKSYSSFVLILGGLGLYVLFTGFVGWKAIKGKSSAVSRWYSFLFFLLLLAMTILVVGMLAWEDRTFEIFADLNGDDGNEIHSYIDSHKTVMKWSAVGVLAVYLFTFILSVSCARKVNGLDDELLRSDMSELDHLTVASSSFGVGATARVHSTPQTDARRAEMSEKYGRDFSRGY